MGGSEVAATPRDRLVPASGAIAALAVLGVLADYLHPFEPKAVLWLPSVLGPIVTFLAFLRTARTTTLPEPTRRFWRHLSCALALVSIGITVQAFNVMTSDDPVGNHTGPVMLAFCTAGVGAIMYALFRLPLGRQSRGELL